LRQLLDDIADTRCYYDENGNEKEMYK
jgi:hypothetical protein